jgi:CRP-like cAMP-binding protein
MLRSHDVAYSVEEEQNIKDQYPEIVAPAELARLLLFVTIHEALVFCENALIHQMGRSNTSLRERFSQQHIREGGSTLAFVFSRILGCSSQEERTLNKLNGKRYHEEIHLRAGEEVFSPSSHSDAFYVVLSGAAAIAIDQNDPRYKEKSRTRIVSGAGVVRHFGSTSTILDPSIRQDSATSPMVVTSIWPVGGIFGYVDFLLERPRYFRVIATQSGTVVAKITMSNLHLMQNEDPVLDGLVQRVLLQASLLDLANCTCGE